MDLQVTLVGIATPVELIGMGWSVAGTTGIFAFEPRTSYAIIFLVEHERDTLQESTELVGCLQTRRTSSVPINRTSRPV